MANYLAVLLNVTPKRILIGLFFIIILAIAGVVLIIARSGYYQLAPASLTVSSGSAVITRANNQTEPVLVGVPVSVNVGDTVHMLGRGVLTFAGAQTDLEQDSQLTLKTYLANGGEAQVELNVLAGQTFHHVAGYNDPRSRFDITTPSARISARGGEFMVWLTPPGPTEVGMFSGTANVSKADGSGGTTLHDGEGATITAEQPPSTKPWSKLRVLLYRPDGSDISLPVSLINSFNSEMYNTSSGQLMMVPAGTYSLRVNLLMPYIATGLTLGTDKVNDISATLSQIMFSTVNSDQTPVASEKLTIRSADRPDTSEVDSGQWILVSPGSWTLIAARSASPDASQKFQVDLAPGQQWSAVLQENLFGAGTLLVNIFAPREAGLSAVDVWVYKAGEENANPILKFKTDGTVQTLPPGDYIVSVRTRIAARQEITIGRGEAKVISVQVGGLAVNYTDGQGKQISRDLYIASSEDLKRLGIPILLMNRTPYGVTVDTNVKLWLPVGTYSLRVDESPDDITRDNVVVTAGQTTTVDLKAAQ